MSTGLICWGYDATGIIDSESEGGNCLGPRGLKSEDENESDAKLIASLRSGVEGNSRVSGILSGQYGSADGVKPW